MMLEEGKVIEVSTSGVVVEFERGVRCEKCSLCRSAAEGGMRLVCGSDIDVRAGERVLVETTAGRRALAGALLFAFPLLCFFGGIVAAYCIGRAALKSPPGEAALFWGGAAGLAAALIALALLGRSARKPRIVSRSSASGEGPPDEPPAAGRGNHVS